MKKLLILLSFLAPVLAQASIISAERMAQIHTTAQAVEVGNRLGVEIYDGPYDGEMPLFHCGLINGAGCLNYAGYIPGISTYEVLPAGATQETEDYLYYHAFRNVNAGYYSSRMRNDYSQFVDSVGFSILLQVEVFMLKTGQKPITLFDRFTKQADLVSLTKEIY